METNIVYLVTVTLESGLLFKYFNLVSNTWIASAKALIIHINIPCYIRIFQFFLNIFTLTFD